MLNSRYSDGKLIPGITISDVKRALANGGDVSFLAPVLARALNNPPLAVAPSLEVPLLLPEADLLLLDKGNRLRELAKSWRQGEEQRALSLANIELILLPLPPHGRNVAAYLECAITGLKPDVLALDEAEGELASTMLYTFSLPAAIGITVYAGIRLKDEGKPYGSRIFYPGSLSETAVALGWLNQIPVVPVGKPYPPGSSALKVADEDVEDEDSSGLHIQEAYRNIDVFLENKPYLSLLAESAERAGLSLENSVSIHINHKLIREAKYAASRLLDFASFVNNPEKKTVILAVLDMKHYPGVKRYLELMLAGVMEENYVRPEGSASQVMLMLGRHAASNPPEAPVPEKTPLTVLFEKTLEEWSHLKQKESLGEELVDKHIAVILERVRTHPQVLRGASVRGSLGLKEVVESLAELNSGITRESLEKAALITLPARLRLKPGTKESKESVVSDTVKEVLYGIEFYHTIYKIVTEGNASWLSPEEINRLLESLSRGKKPEGAVDEANDKNTNEKLLKALAAQKFIQRSLEGGYVLTSKSIERLLEDLEQRAREGKLSPDTYDLEKTRLEEMLFAARESEYEIPSKELAGMVMDFMDVVDKGFEKDWGKDINFLRLFLYYRMKYESGNKHAPWQKDWTELKHRLEMLERRGILKTSLNGGERTVSGLGLATLLEYLEPRNEELKSLREGITRSKTIISLRSEEIRPLTAANTYRDISFRHTLKEIAKQKKELSGVRRSDFRVYTKPQLKQHTDIVLCLDTSGSMAEHRKLIYARLAAAAVASAAQKSDDRTAVVSFEDAGRTSIPLSDESNGLVNDYLAVLGASGATNIGDGIKCAVDLLTRDLNHNKKRIFLITDGEPNAISEKALNQLKGKTPGDLTEEAALVETRRAAARGISLSVIYLAAEKIKGYAFVKNIARAGKGKVIMINCRDEEPILKEYGQKYVEYQEYR